MNRTATSSDQTSGLRSRGYGVRVPTRPQETDPAWAERFWARIDRSAGPGACWPWLKGKSNGYGSLLFRGAVTYSHRVACILTHGDPPPDRQQALHGCDNRICCNPAHLRWGTPRENFDEAVERRRIDPVRNGLASASARRRRERQARGTPFTPLTPAQLARLEHELPIDPALHARVHELAEAVEARRITLAEAEHLVVS